VNNHNKVLCDDRASILNHLKNLDQVDQFHLGRNAAVALLKEHRPVLDLDFFTYQAFNADALIDHLQTKFDVTVVLKFKSMLSLLVGSVKVAFCEYAYQPLHEPRQSEWGFLIDDQRDIAAMLLCEITEHPSRWDYVDIYYIFKEYNSLIPLLETFEQRYPEKSNMRSEILHLLSHFDEKNINEPMPEFYDEITWKEIKQIITVDAKKLYYKEDLNR